MQANAGRDAAEPRKRAPRATIPLTERALALDTLPAGARLTARDVLALLNCSKSTLLRKLREQEFIPPLPGSKALEWRAGDVRRYLNGGEA